MKILLIEDDANLAEGLTQALKHESFLVACAETGASGMSQLVSFEPDLVVLDLGLPDMDGVEILSLLRKKRKSILVLILTARTELSDKIAALDGGADDYLAKPFEMQELLARIRVLSRRLGTATTSVIAIGDVSLDIASHTVTVNNTEVNLPRREYMTLKSLMVNAGRVQTKEMLEVSLYDVGEVIGSNTIEVHVSNLRKKMPKGFIKTIRGVGYTLSTKNSSAQLDRDRESL